MRCREGGWKSYADDSSAALRGVVLTKKRAWSSMRMQARAVRTAGHHYWAVVVVAVEWV
jgi:hypothetical protein